MVQDPPPPRHVAGREDVVVLVWTKSQKKTASNAQNARSVKDSRREKLNHDLKRTVVAKMESSIVNLNVQARCSPLVLNQLLDIDIDFLTTALIL
ncbi:hypothetical protein ACEPAI_4348 [Sanghuangporus weigelae]